MPIIELATSFLINIAKDSYHDWAKQQGAGLISWLRKKALVPLGDIERPLIICGSRYRPKCNNRHWSLQSTWK